MFLRQKHVVPLAQGHALRVRPEPAPGRAGSVRYGRERAPARRLRPGRPVRPADKRDDVGGQRRRRKSVVVAAVCINLCVAKSERMST